MRRAAKRDTTEAAIVQALERVSRVLRLNVFDLLVLSKGRLYMLDAKTGKGRITPAQQRLLDAGWPLVFVRSPEEALRAIGAIR